MTQQQKAQILAAGGHEEAAPGHAQPCVTINRSEGSHGSSAHGSALPNRGTWCCRKHHASPQAASRPAGGRIRRSHWLPPSPLPLVASRGTAPTMPLLATDAAASRARLTASQPSSWWPAWWPAAGPPHSSSSSLSSAQLERPVPEGAEKMAASSSACLSALDSAQVGGNATWA